MRRALRALGLAGALALAAPVAGASDDYAVRECFMQASAKFQEPTTVMATIALTNGCWVGYEGRNDNRLRRPRPHMHQLDP